MPSSREFSEARMPTGACRGRLGSTLATRRCRDPDLEQLRRVAPEDRRLVVTAERCTADEADGIGLGHVERIVAAQENVIAAPALDQILELVMRKDDGVEIELGEMARRSLGDLAAAVGTSAMGVVHAA